MNSLHLDMVTSTKQDNLGTFKNCFISPILYQFGNKSDIPGHGIFLSAAFQFEIFFCSLLFCLVTTFINFKYSVNRLRSTPRDREKVLTLSEVDLISIQRNNIAKYSLFYHLMLKCQKN